MKQKLLWIVFALATAAQGASLDAGTRLRVRSPVPGRIVILKDGAVWVDETGNAKEIAVTERGVYRVEVYLPQVGNLPWIISNPVYVR